MRNELKLTLLTSMLFGCQTIPDDAPNVFHSTHEKLERASDQDVDDYLPKTMEQAEDQFGSAVSKLKDARRADPKDTQKEQQAANEAELVGKNVDNAIDLTARIRQWDGDIQQYASFVADHGYESVASVNAEEVIPTTEFEMSSTVAFFPTAEADLRDADHAQLEKLAEMMKKNPTLRVELIGFADPRGPEAFNQDLGMKRVESVAAKLRDLGIQGDRITEVSKGETAARTNDAASEADLQLDRRVDVNVTTYLTH